MIYAFVLQSLLLGYGTTVFAGVSENCQGYLNTDDLIWVGTTIEYEVLIYDESGDPVTSPVPLTSCPSGFPMNTNCFLKLSFLDEADVEIGNNGIEQVGNPVWRVNNATDVTVVSLVYTLKLNLP